ncbi:MAG: hypothetical protein IJ583_07575 [Firmicutes bacterium]|nr:hypothetical protein [Bacillota bacterium]
MGKATVNVKSAKKCAFCKYWYDPTNSAISPKFPKQNMWEYDNSIRCKCLQKNIDMPSTSLCAKYECKLELF